MFLINQPWDGRGQRIGDYINRFLNQDTPRFENFRVCVAFAKASGILELAPAIQDFMKRGGLVEMVVGIDEKITSKQALELVMKFSTEAYVFKNPASTFHPKLYLFEAAHSAIAIVGSSNLTSGGLYTNYEANIGIEFDLTIKEDLRIYKNILAIFSNVKEIATGNTRLLDMGLLKELVRRRLVGDETRPSRKNVKLIGNLSGKASPFLNVPVPPAPRIAPEMRKLIPRIPISHHPANHETTAYHPWQTFVMTLGERDTRQGRGFSHDVYIPIAARDFDGGFWGWPGKFKSSSSVTRGKYKERRINILVRPVTGQVQFVKGVRLYYYDIKHEFRLNCGRLVEGAKAGDLLVVQKSPFGTLFGGRSCHLEAMVFRSGLPGYDTFAKECKNQVSGSPKCWGYL